VNDNIDASVLVLSHEPIKHLDHEDVNLFSLMFRQVGLMLEDLLLLKVSSSRLRELDLLLDFSRELGTLNPSNILQALLDSVMQVLPAGQAGFVALWNDQQQLLLPQLAKGYKEDELILDCVYEAGQGLPGKVYSEGHPVRVDEVDFINQYDLSSDELIILKNATGGLLPVSAIIVPIKAAENILGVLTLENFETPRAFSEEDQSLITSLVNQAALALENARLYQASEERALQLHGLTKVASTITSSLQVNEINNLLVFQIQEIIPFDTGTLWLRQGDLMTIRAAHGFDDSDRRMGLSISIAESALLQEMIETNRPLYVGDVTKDVRFPSLDQHTYRSWLGVPLISKDEVIGVIALEKVEQEYYSSKHIQAAVTFAGQAAVALENAKLYEESVRRMIELDERSQRLSMLNRLSTALSGSLDVEHILKVAIDEIGRAIECSSIFCVLFDASGRAYLRAQSPPIISSLPHLLPESPLFDRLRESLGVFSSWDIEKEAVLDSLMSVLTKYKTLSLLVIPLSTGSDLHGLFFIIQEQSYRFDADEVELIRTISNQVAVAIQNAHLFSETEQLFSETRQISAELATLFEMGVNITQMLDKGKLLKKTFQNSMRMTQADSIALVVLGDKEELILEAIDRGEWVGPISIARTGESLSEYVLKTGQPLLVRNFEKERENLPGKGITLGEPIKSWLGVPLIVRGSTVGVISAQAYRENAFGNAQRRLLSQVGNQLAVALDNTRLFETVQTYAADLEERVSERTQELEKEHQRLQMLLNIIAELSSSLDLDMVLNRALELISESVGAEFSQIQFYRFNEKTLYIPSFFEVKPSKSTNGSHSHNLEISLAELVLSEHQPLKVPDLSADSRWAMYDQKDLFYSSVIVVPLIVGEEVLGAMLLFHQQVNYFTSDQLEIVQAAAKQIAVAINNAQLFYLIRDQAERLGDMLHMQHIETSRSNAMLEAVADGVLVTDSSRTITLFNASAERILSLNRNRVVGRKLE
jgi:GAF domain-containing protein